MLYILVKIILFILDPTHIDVRYHWIRDVLDAELLELEKVHIDENGSYIMTKALPRWKIEICCLIAGLPVTST